MDNDKMIEVLAVTVKGLAGDLWANSVLSSIKRDTIWAKMDDILDTLEEKQEQQEQSE